jgi:DNA-binding PadR family transcriptional regulator
MMGGGFGPPGFGGRGFGRRGFSGRGGRRAGRGDVRASVLALLAEQPMHGYQMLGELAERSGGTWRPSPGSVYPVLQQLQDEGLVQPEETDGSRVFHLTEAGRAYVEEHRDELAAPWEAMAGSRHEGTHQLFQVMSQVGAATWQLAQAGGDAQIEKATALLAEARRNLYRILAEDEPTTSSDA